MRQGYLLPIHLVEPVASFVLLTKVYVLNWKFEVFTTSDTGLSCGNECVNTVTRRVFVSLRRVLEKSVNVETHHGLDTRPWKVSTETDKTTSISFEIGLIRRGYKVRTGSKGDSMSKSIRN